MTDDEIQSIADRAAQKITNKLGAMHGLSHENQKPHFAEMIRDEIKAVVLKRRGYTPVVAGPGAQQNGPNSVIITYDLPKP